MAKNSHRSQRYTKVELATTPWAHGFRISDRRTTASTLHIIHQGAVEITWQGQRQTVTAPNMYWIPAAQPLSWYCPHGAVERTTLYIRGEAWSPGNKADAEAIHLIRDLNNCVRNTGPVFPCQEDTFTHICQMMNHINELFQQPELPYHSSSLKAHACLILAALHGDAHIMNLPQDDHQQLSEQAASRVEPALIELDEPTFIAQEDITITTLADLCGYRPSRFHALFVQATGVTPQRYLTERRIARACDLLQHTEQRVIDIAYASGFSSQSRFYHAFTKIIGISPARWRRQTHQKT